MPRPSVPLDDLRSLCVTLWNPIGVPMANQISELELGQRPMPADEYDACLFKVWSLVTQGRSAQDIRGYLSEVERDLIGASTSDRDKDAFIAAVQDRWGKV